MTGTLQQYVNYFDSLLNQLEPTSITETMKIQLFVKGLRPTRLQEEVKFARPKSLFDAMAYALDYDACHPSLRYGESQRAPQLQHKGRPERHDHRKQQDHIKTCTNCGLRGHSVDECRKKKRPEDQQNNSSNYKRSYGSQSPQPQQKNGPSQINQAAATYKQTSPKPLKHVQFKQDKPKQGLPEANACHHFIVSSGELERYPVTTALINGVEVEVIFDGGAKQSVLPIETVKKAKIPIIKDSKCRLANGEVDTCLDTDKTTIILHGTITELSFIALPRKNVLLGLDWLNANNAYLVSHRNELVFDKRVVNLEQQDEATLADDELQDEMFPTWEVMQENSKEVRDQMIKESIESAHSNAMTYGAMLKETDTISKDEIAQLFTNHVSAFATAVDQLEQACTVSEHRIQLEQDAKPIHIMPYRKSKQERELIKNEVNKMLENGIIRKSRSPWSSPALLIKKKNNTWRFCVDFRKMNKQTKRDPYPLQRIDDIFDNLSESRWFSLLDLKSGYWQIKMDEESTPFTAFTTPDGHFEFTRLQFGLKNAPSDFCRIMQRVLGDLPFVQVYIDDVIVHSKNLREHLDNIKQVIERLSEASLKINIEKCTWFRTELKILGHIIGNNEVKMDMEKIKVIKEYKRPTKVLHIQQFLGLCGYYRKFVKDFAKIAAPLSSTQKRNEMDLGRRARRCVPTANHKTNILPDPETTRLQQTVYNSH